MSETAVVSAAPALAPVVDDGLDGAWLGAVAHARGVALTPARASELAAAVAPTLRVFRAAVAELRPDDDMLELRRLLLAEASR